MIHNLVGLSVLLCFVTLATGGFIIFSTDMLQMAIARSSDYNSEQSKGRSEAQICSFDGIPVQCPEGDKIIQRNTD